MTGLFQAGFTLWRPSYAHDGAGGDVETLAQVAVVSGRLTPLGGTQQRIADQERGVVSHRFACAGATDIRPGDQLRVGARRLEVQAVQTTSTGRRKEAICEERT